MRSILRALLFSVVALPVYAIGTGSVVEFETAEQKALYNKMLEELRCTVCQNQSLADSNAELAKDLRKHLYEQVREGADQKQIKDFMVQRYGEFVLYKPVLKPMNYLLWFGPFVLLVVAIVVMRLNIRSHEKRKSHTDMTPEEWAILKKHLNEAEEKK